MKNTNSNPRGTVKASDQSVTTPQTTWLLGMAHGDLRKMGTLNMNRLIVYFSIDYQSLT